MSGDGLGMKRTRIVQGKGVVTETVCDGCGTASYLPWHDGYRRWIDARANILRDFCPDCAVKIDKQGEAKMMITRSQTKTCYFLICDGCGSQSPRARSPEAALQAARAEGWSTEEQWNGLSYIKNHLCEQCRKDEENEDNEDNP